MVILVIEYVIIKNIVSEKKILKGYSCLAITINYLTEQSSQCDQ